MGSEDPDPFTDDWLVSHPDCVEWFDDPDIRDRGITCWPDEYVNFIGEVVEYLASRDPKVTAKNFWVLGKCVAGTSFQDRLIECRNSLKILLELGPRLRPSDFVPPVLSHELESCREAVCDDADWNLQFLELLLHVMDGPCELSDVTTELRKLFEGVDPTNEAYYCLRDGFTSLLRSLFPWVERDVELGRSLGAGPSDVISADFSKSIADLLAGNSAVVEHGNDNPVADGLYRDERLLVWEGGRYEWLPETGMDALELLLKKHPNKVSPSEMTRKIGVIPMGGFKKVFYVNRKEVGGYKKHPVAEIIGGRAPAGWYLITKKK